MLDTVISVPRCVTRGWQVDMQHSEVGSRITFLVQKPQSGNGSRHFLFQDLRKV